MIKKDDKMESLVDADKWHDGLLEKYPDFLDFAEAISHQVSVPNYPFAFGVAQSVIYDLVGQLRRIKAETTRKTKAR
jgi:hypothetical protein